MEADDRSGFWVLPAMFVVPGVILVLCYRVRAWVEGGELVVRSHIRTQRFEFEQLIGFNDVAYEGFWGRNGYAMDGWGQLWRRMVDGGDVELPALMCGPKVCKRVVEALNTRVPEELPEGWGEE